MKLKRTFFMTLSFFVLIFLTLTFSKQLHKVSAKELPKWKQELQMLQDQITEFQNMKRGYVARALKHENQAQRLQFMNGEYLTAKRHWELAKENRIIAEKIQIDIDRLEEKRQDLLQENGALK